MKIRIYLLGLVALLISFSLLMSGCNRSEPGPDEFPRNRGGNLVRTEPTPTPLGEISKPADGPLKVGDIGQVGEITIKLNSAEYKDGQYTINLTVQNKGQIEQNINPAFYFRIEGNDGNIATFMNFGTPNPRLRSSVPANDDVTGNIAFQTIEELKQPKLIYDPRGSAGTIIWQLQ